MSSPYSTTTVRTLLAALSIWLAVPALALQDASQPDPLVRPRYQLLAQDEDWSVLLDADPEDLDDPFDRIKLVPLTADGSTWITFGGQARARAEVWRNFNFGQAPPDARTNDRFVLFRFLLHADLHFREDFRVFVQGKSAFLTDRELPGGKRPADEDRLDLQQAFVDLGSGDFTLRAGRAMLQLGKERLVSPLDWSNTLRAWDGVQGILAADDWELTGFWTRFVEVDPTGFNEPDDENQFYGLYTARAGSGSRPELDLYWLGFHDDDSAFNGTAGREERHTFGARIGGRIGASAWDYDVEGAYQLGRVGSGDVRAWMVGSELGHTFREAAGRPRAWLGFDYASGDDEPGGDVGTFNQLYPLGHAYLGYVDVIGRQNIVAANLGVGVTPTAKLRLRLAHHAFWLADKEDALYNAGGAVLRPGGSADSSFVGNEVDLTATYTFDRHLSALLGYSRFFAGDAIRQSGPSQDIDFVYLSLQYSF